LIKPLGILIVQDGEDVNRGLALLGVIKIKIYQ